MKPLVGEVGMAAPAIKAIIFDCFGVLYVDSKKSLLDIVPLARQAELHDIFTANNYGYYDKNEYLAQVAAVTGMTPQQVADYAAHEHRANQRLLEVIRSQLRGRYKLGLLSNIGREWIYDFFSKHQLHELFDEVVLSGEEGITKPSVAIFELMAERLGLEPAECLMIDDIVENCTGAQAAGMRTIHFQDTTQLLGELYNMIDIKSD